MKRLATLCLAACLAATLATPAGALDYVIDILKGSDYDRPTLVEVVHTVDGGVLKNEDTSKNATLIPPSFGSASVDTLNTRTWLTPNPAPKGMTVGAINGSGMSVVFPPSVDTFTIVPAEPEQETEFSGTLDYIPMVSDLYYSDGYLGTLEIPAIGLSVRVYEGTDSPTLMKGAGHFKGTSIWDGNCATAGHSRGMRDDPRDLHTLGQGDTTTWTTRLGVRTHEVTSVQRVKGTDTNGTASSNENRLTLCACVRSRGIYRWQVQVAEVVQSTLLYGLIFSIGSSLCYRLFPRFPICCYCKEHEDNRGKKEANRVKRKQFIPTVLTGTSIGAALMGPASTGVAALATAPSAQIFYVNGEQVDLEAYVINGHNYVQLRDVGRTVNFDVAHDRSANRVLINTGSPYTEESAVPAPSGVVTVPQLDEPFRLKEGDKVLCDDDTTYGITDLRLWGEPEPLPTYDQTCFSELELPRAEVCQFQGEYGDNLHIRNPYETRWMEYTIYNAAMNYPKPRTDGAPAPSLRLGISAWNAV